MESLFIIISQASCSIKLRDEAPGNKNRQKAIENICFSESPQSFKMLIFLDASFSPSMPLIEILKMHGTLEI